MSDWRALGNEIDRWPSALAALPEDERNAQLTALYRAWVGGELEALAGDAAPADHDRHIGRVLSSLPEAWEEAQIIDCVNPSSAELRRWCWGRDFFLMSEDEDLLLMDDRYVAPLFEEVKLGCIKRDYALSIVAHHARDSLHHTLFADAKKTRARLKQIASWLPAAREVNDGALVAYLERLAGYLQPHEVAKAEVVQRVHDLRRCDPDRGAHPHVRRDGPHWIARLDLANVTPGELFVEAATGKMWAEKRPT